MAFATTTVQNTLVSPEHRVRHYMVSKIPYLKPEQTVADVHALLWKHSDYDTVKFLYVTDQKKHLIGVISFKDLFRYAPDAIIGDIMNETNLVSVSPQDDDERTVYLALRYGLSVVPVVEYGKLIGVVPSAKLLKILQLDATENIAEATAAPTASRTIFDNVLTQPLWQSLVQRAPWLLFGLCGGIFAADIIAHFEDVLARNLILASYIPLVVYLSGAISAQIQMFYIRDLAIDPQLPLLRYLIRQTIVVAILGSLVSAILYAINAYILGLGTIALVISFSTLAAIFSALISGIGIPFVLSKVLKDPASAAPPIAIIASDLLTVFLYFIVASQML